MSKSPRNLVEGWQSASKKGRTKTTQVVPSLHFFCMWHSSPVNAMRLGISNIVHIDVGNCQCACYRYVG